MADQARGGLETAASGARTDVGGGVWAIMDEEDAIGPGDDWDSEVEVSETDFENRSIEGVESEESET